MIFVLILTPVLCFETPVYAGSSFSGLSQVTSVVTVDNAKTMERIAEQIRIARAKSAHALSKDEIEKIKLQAELAIANQAEMVIQPGASVFMGSQIIE